MTELRESWTAGREAVENRMVYCYTAADVVGGCAGEPSLFAHGPTPPGATQPSAEGRATSDRPPATPQCSFTLLAPIWDIEGLTRQGLSAVAKKLDFRARGRRLTTAPRPPVCTI